MSTKLIGTVTIVSNKIEAKQDSLTFGISLTSQNNYSNTFEGEIKDYSLLNSSRTKVPIEKQDGIIVYPLSEQITGIKLIEKVNEENNEKSIMFTGIASGDGTTASFNIDFSIPVEWENFTPSIIMTTGNSDNSLVGQGGVLVFKSEIISNSQVRVTYIGLMPEEGTNNLSWTFLVK